MEAIMGPRRYARVENPSYNHKAVFRWLKPVLFGEKAAGIVIRAEVEDMISSLPEEIQYSQTDGEGVHVG